MVWRIVVKRQMYDCTRGNSKGLVHAFYYQVNVNYLSPQAAFPAKDNSLLGCGVNELLNNI